MEAQVEPREEAVVAEELAPSAATVVMVASDMSESLFSDHESSPSH